MFWQACYFYFILIIGNLKERSHFEDLGLDGMIILKWIYEKCLVGDELDLYNSG